MTVCLNRLGSLQPQSRRPAHARSGLKARQKRSFKPKTTDSNHPHPIAPNRLAAARQTQIAQSHLGQRHHLHPYRSRLALPGRRHGPLQQKNRRLGHRRPPQNLLGRTSHAPRRALAQPPKPDCSITPIAAANMPAADYRQLLSSLKALPSMSSTGNCYDNAAMESFWSTLKTEWLHQLQLPHSRRSPTGHLRLHRNLL